MFKLLEEKSDEKSYIRYFLIQGSPDYIAMCFYKYIYCEIDSIDNDRKPILSKSIEHILNTECNVFAFIERIEVNPFYRGQGEAKKLLESVLEDNSVDLSMLVSLPIEDDTSLNSEELSDFYENIGYETIYDKNIGDAKLMSIIY